MRRVSIFAVPLLLANFVTAGVAAATTDSPDSAATEAAARPDPAKQSSEGRFPIGVGVKVSTLGIGGEVAVGLSQRSNVRFGFNAFSYEHTFDKDGATYQGTLDLRSAQATYDIFLVRWFHISPGVLIYNGNQISAKVSVPGGQTFSLSKTTYISDAADPVAGTGKLTVYKTAPMVLFGFGNLVPRNGHFSTSFEIGAAYQGPPRVALNLGGSACDSTGLFCRSIASDPTIQSNIVAEQAKLNKSASPYKFYPVLSFGVGYRF
jgi:hypothetical protein